MKHVSTSILAVAPKSVVVLSRSTDLVKVLQEVDYPALNLFLVKTGRGGIEADSREGKARS
jgi:hypothetical protein